MLIIKDICKTYDNKHQVLKNTTMQVDKDVKVLLGINGCGKSTLLKIITGVLDCESGSVTIDGRDILALPAEQRKVGYVPQHTALFPHLTIYENIVYGLRGKEERAAQKEHIDKLVSLLELEDFLENKPRQLSGGYKSRASLARALAPNPCLMLLDEPLSDIDVVMKERLLPEFKKVIHAMRVPAIYVTHDPSEAEKVGDSFAAMVKGDIFDCESAEQAFDFIREKEMADIEARLFSRKQA